MILKKFKQIKFFFEDEGFISNKSLINFTIFCNELLKMREKMNFYKLCNFIFEKFTEKY